MWTRLAGFPTTPALCLSGIGLAYATFVASLTGWQPPDGWLLFVGGFVTIGAGQFTAKRMTFDPAKAEAAQQLRAANVP